MSYYSASIHCHYRFWLVLFLWLLDAAITNAIALYNEHFSREKDWLYNHREFQVTLGLELARGSAPTARKQHTK